MTLGNIIKRFKKIVAFTFSLVVVESVIGILIPLFIGFAINDVLKGEQEGLWQLGVLGLTVLVISGSRRFYDTRGYAKIFRALASEIYQKGRDVNKSSSTVTAHVGLVEEMIEFLEHSLPELSRNVIGLIGVLAIIAGLNIVVFAGCLTVSLLIVLVYWHSSNKTMKYNWHFNNELEKRVDVISSGNKSKVEKHLFKLMGNSIHLSDIETLNFSVIWGVMIFLLLGSIVIVTDSGIVNYGIVFSIIMYVFQFMENVINLPYFYQQSLRLRDISKRLSEV